MRQWPSIVQRFEPLSGRGCSHGVRSTDRLSRPSRNAQQAPHVPRHTHDDGVERRDPGAPAAVDADGSVRLGEAATGGACSVAAVAAGSTQVVRPHDRWRAYRREQRLLEADRIAYVHRAGEYASSERDRVLIERVISGRRSILDQWLELTPETATARSALGSCRGRAKKAADASMQGSSDGRLGTFPLASAIRRRDALLPVTVRTMARRSRSAAAPHSRIRCPVRLTPCVLIDEHEALRVGGHDWRGPAGAPKGSRRSSKDERICMKQIERGSQRERTSRSTSSAGSTPRHAGELPSSTSWRGSAPGSRSSSASGWRSRTSPRWPRTRCSSR